MKKCELCDLSGANLSGLNLTRANLAGANLRGANHEKTDFSAANLRGAKLQGANLKGAKLTDADLRGARLSGASLVGANLERVRLERAWLLKADLRETNLLGARLTGSTLEGADLRNTSLKRISLSKVILRGVNFSGADLEGYRFDNADLSGANFVKANLQRVNFYQAKLIGANLSDSDLRLASLESSNAQNANFSAADLTGANLRKARLTGADFSGAQLGKANLTDAKLTRATFVKTNLTGANLRHATLNNAVLTGADMASADLRHTSFISADLTGADLSKTWLQNANLGAASLDEASLEKADLAGADLRFAKLNNTRMAGAKFSQTDLRGATVTGDALKNANTVGAKLDRNLQAALAPTDAKSASGTGGTEKKATRKEKNDLVTERIEKSGLSVALVDVAKIPASSAKKPFARINWLHHAGDDSGRLFVADMRGKIHIIRNGQVQATPFLDLSTLRSKTLYAKHEETGLSAFAFHPDYATPGRAGFGLLFTVHTERGSPPPGSAPQIFRSPLDQVRHDDVLIVWRVDPRNPDRIDASSAREILRIQQPHEGHNIAMLGFNPVARRGSSDYGMLYLGVGDGGDTLYSGVVDAQRVAQNRTTPFGAILRINPLSNGRTPYTVPPDNPFVGKPGHLPELWAYGLRNPSRFSWDTGGTGKMIISDVGESGIEELNLGVRSANYGWSERKGTFMVDHNKPSRLSRVPDDDRKYHFTYPVAQYDHSEGKAVIGGFVYRGWKNPDLQGLYVFGDRITGRMFYIPVKDLAFGRQAKIRELTLHYGGRPQTLLQILGNDARADLHFGMGQDGEIFVLTMGDGMVRTLRPVTDLQSKR
jgi:uncharacterized protein YjbI with pentapeptide repeats